MTYQELINAFKQFAADHKQIMSWGYGQISDIEHPIDPATGELKTRDYPYLFLNPTSHSLTQGTATYRFNAICMQLTDDEIQAINWSGLDSVIKAQSDAQQILNDFLSWLEYTDQIDSQLVRTTQLTPFRERFNDTVAGMTATVEVQLRNSLDLCAAPIKTYTLLRNSTVTDPFIDYGDYLNQGFNQLDVRWDVPADGTYKFDIRCKFDQLVDLTTANPFIQIFADQEYSAPNRVIYEEPFSNVIGPQEVHFQFEVDLGYFGGANNVYFLFGHWDNNVPPTIQNAMGNVTTTIKIWKVD